MPGKTPVLILPGEGVVERLILEGIPHVDFNHPKCFPNRGRGIPTWIDIQLPEAGNKGRISAQVTLGRRIPRSQKSKSTAVLAADVCDPVELEESEVEDMVVVEALTPPFLGTVARLLSRGPRTTGVHADLPNIIVSMVTVAGILSRLHPV